MIKFRDHQQDAFLLATVGQFPIQLQASGYVSQFFLKASRDRFFRLKSKNNPHKELVAVTITMLLGADDIRALIEMRPCHIFSGYKSPYFERKPPQF